MGAPGAYLGFVQLHLLTLFESKELFRCLHDVSLKLQSNAMIDDLEESLCGTGLVDLIRDMLHPLGVARQKVRKVNDGGRL